MRPRAVITGLGIVSPLGTGVAKFWGNASRGRSGLGAPTFLDTSELPDACHSVGEVSDFCPERWMPESTARVAGRFTQFALACARMAMDDSGLDQPDLPPARTQVIIGTAMNGTADIGEPTHAAHLQGQAIPPWAVLASPGHSVTSHVAIMIGARGQANTIATACAAGLDAIGSAASAIHTGTATLVLAGGTDAPLSSYTLNLFHSAGVLSRWSGPPSQASRPFDRLRSGLVLSEGAALLLIENEDYARARGARIYAAIRGFSGISEAVHLRKVDMSGASDSRVLSDAIAAAGLHPRDIDYISAHGNGMVDYDAAETAGIKHAFSSHAWNVPISSIKSMTGQMLGATGALQVVAACLSLRDQLIPPTINYQVPDPACDLDYVPNLPRHARIRHVLVHAHGLGGSHSALVLSHPDYVV
jgi:3-oxoacyl-[acyl-carrier-protein] synthase II